MTYGRQSRVHRTPRFFTSNKSTAFLQKRWAVQKNVSHAVMLHTPIKLPTVSIITSRGNNPNHGNRCTKHTNASEITTAIRFYNILTAASKKHRTFHHRLYAGISKYMCFYKRKHFSCIFTRISTSIFSKLVNKTVE